MTKNPIKCPENMELVDGQCCCHKGSPRSCLGKTNSRAMYGEQGKPQGPLPYLASTDDGKKSMAILN